jgi:NAD(P)H-nitrite reductase large subunit
MNSLKHLGLPLMAVGITEGDVVLRWRRAGILRKAFLADGRLVGFRLTGDVRGGGFLHDLLVRGVDVRPLGDRLVRPGSALAASIPPVAFAR